MELRKKVMTYTALIGFLLAALVAAFCESDFVLMGIGISSIIYMFLIFYILEYFCANILYENWWKAIVSVLLYFCSLFFAGILYGLSKGKFSFALSTLKTLLFGVVLSLLYLEHIYFDELHGQKWSNLFAKVFPTKQHKKVIKSTAIIGFSISTLVSIFVHHEFVLLGFVVLVFCIICALFFISAILEILFKKRFNNLALTVIKIISPVLLGLIGFNFFFGIHFPDDQTAWFSMLSKCVLYGVTLSILIAEQLYYNKSDKPKHNSE